MVRVPSPLLWVYPQGGTLQLLLRREALKLRLTLKVHPNLYFGLTLWWISLHIPGVNLTGFQNIYSLLIAKEPEPFRADHLSTTG